MSRTHTRNQPRLIALDDLPLFSQSPILATDDAPFIPTQTPPDAPQMALPLEEVSEYHEGNHYHVWTVRQHPILAMLQRSDVVGVATYEQARALAMGRHHSTGLPIFDICAGDLDGIPSRQFEERISINERISTCFRHPA